MYAKSTTPSAKREVQKDRSAKRDDQIARPRRAQACELRAMRMCPQSGQIFSIRIDKKVPIDFFQRQVTYFTSNLFQLFYNKNDRHQIGRKYPFSAYMFHPGYLLKIRKVVCLMFSSTFYCKITINILHFHFALS